MILARPHAWPAYPATLALTGRRVEEVTPRPTRIIDRLHQRHTGHLGQPSALLSCLGRGDNAPLNFGIRQLDSGAMGLAAHAQCVVEHHSSATEHPRQHRLLSRCRFDAVPVTQLHNPTLRPSCDNPDLSSPRTQRVDAARAPKPSGKQAEAAPSTTPTSCMSSSTRWGGSSGSRRLPAGSQAVHANSACRFECAGAALARRRRGPSGTAPVLVVRTRRPPRTAHLGHLMCRGLRHRGVRRSAGATAHHAPRRRDRELLSRIAFSGNKMVNT